MNLRRAQLFLTSLEPYIMQSTVEKWRHLVVHCKKSKYDVYIGRSCKGMPVTDATWGNPFVMRNNSEAERVRVIESYREWIMQQPELMQRAKIELRGKVLACWCAPLACHGHVLADIANVCEDSLPQAPQASRIPTFLPPAPPMTVTQSTTSSSPALTPAQQKNKRRSEARRKKRLAQETSGAASANTTAASEPPFDAKSEGGFGTVIDIGINITSKQLLPHWKAIVSRAFDSTLSAILLTGTSVRCTEKSLRLATEWNDSNSAKGRLYCTAGVHPHEAKTFTESTTVELRALLSHPSVVAVGECGLDYNRNFSSKPQQLHAFREQVQLAVDLNMPLFVHEREAHEDLLHILDSFGSRLPPVVIHCFTGTETEARAYVNRGYSIGFTGTICKHQRGAPLRAILSKGVIPLHRIMLETDAPWMGFLPDRRYSEPADVNSVAEEMAKCLQVDVVAVRRVTTQNAQKFFNLA